MLILSALKLENLSAFLNNIKMFKCDLLHMRRGETRLMPIKSIPQYIASPKPAIVAMAADTLPSSPSSGLERTQSTIMHVSTLATGNNSK